MARRERRTGGQKRQRRRRSDLPRLSPAAGLDPDAELDRLGREAAAVSAMGRLREIVAFVGEGRTGTTAGNLKVADAVALAKRLGTGERLAPEPQSMDDLPETARLFRRAAASELLARRGTKIVPGPLAADLHDDPLAAWLAVIITLFQQGVVDGFRKGWRKSYVESLDGSAAGLIVAIAQAGGAVPRPLVEDGAWDQVSSAYGYEPDDDAERDHVVRITDALVAELGETGITRSGGDTVELTELGTMLAALMALMAGDDDQDDDDMFDLDLVDIDAQSLLLVCAEEMDPVEATEHLQAWCDCRSGDEAAAELCEAMLDDDDPAVWALGFQALAMVNRADADRAVGRLRRHPGLGPLADAWRRDRR